MGYARHFNLQKAAPATEKAVKPSRLDPSILSEEAGVPVELDAAQFSDLAERLMGRVE